MEYENKFYRLLICLIGLGLMLFQCEKSSDLYEDLEYENFKLKYMNKTEEHLEQDIKSITEEIKQTKRRIESTSKKRNEISVTFINFLHPEALTELEDIQNKAKTDSLRLIEAHRDLEDANNRLGRLTSGSQISVQIITTRKDRVERFEHRISEELKGNDHIDVDELFLVINEFKEKFESIELPITELPVNYSNININNSRTVAKRLLSNLQIYKDSLNAELIRENMKRQKEIEQITKERERYLNTTKRIKQELKNNAVHIEKKKHDIEHSSERFEETIRDHENETILLNKKIYRLFMEKYNSQLVLFEKRLENSGLKSDEIKAMRRRLHEMQKEFIKDLQTGNYDQIENQRKKLEKMITNLSTKFSDLQQLVSTIRKLFEGTAFSTFLASGDTTEVEDPNIQMLKETFNEIIPTLKQFLLVYSKYKIYIDGYADRAPYFSVDSSGNKKVDPYGNIELSKRRAEYAKNKLISFGIKDSTIIVDWFGEFHNRLPITAGIKQPYLKDRRVDLHIIGKRDTIPHILQYLSFKYNYTITNDSIIFKHADGFWTQFGYYDSRAKVLKLYYESPAFNKLLERQSFLTSLFKPKESPLYPNGSFRLGNQVRLIVEINGTPYRLEVSKYGFKEINEIPYEEIISFLYQS